LKKGTKGRKLHHLVAFQILVTAHQGNVAMSLKQNLKAEIKLDRLFQSLISTMREPPGRRWLDKELTKELLALTDFEYKKVRDLDLYIRPLKGEIMEVAVLDNELPIYHTTVADVTLRKSPYWQQMFSIRNVRKIMIARSKLNGGVVPAFEHLVLFDEENLSLGLKKGTFRPQSDSDLGWILQYARGEETADLQGIHVFEFLAELAMVKARAERV
jgi:hypothetical protein